MTQTILNFKLESTNEKLTPRTGVAILGEYLKGIKLKELCNTNLPKAKKTMVTQHLNLYIPESSESSCFIVTEDFLMTSEK